jgi:hypothetical protein
MIVKLDTRRIRDWATFHDVFTEVFGFPPSYGRNVNAWADYMADLDAPASGTTAVHVPPGETLVLELEQAGDFRRRCPELFQALIECTAFVNRRRTEAGGKPMLVLSFGQDFIPARAHVPAHLAAPRSPAPPSRWFPALAGTLVLCVLVPCVLTWCRTQGVPFEQGTFRDHPPTSSWSPLELFSLLFCTFFLCGPGALLLAYLMLLRLRRFAGMGESAERPAITRGALWGTLIGFLDFPGYLALIFFYNDPYGILRVAVLFAVTGATCGAWIAWQAYRERHPERGFLPRFSLRTLVVGVMAWGVLLGLFFPDV